MLAGSNATKLDRLWVAGTSTTVAAGLRQRMAISNQHTSPSKEPAAVMKNEGPPAEQSIPVWGFITTHKHQAREPFAKFRWCVLYTANTNHRQRSLDNGAANRRAADRRRLWASNDRHNTFQILEAVSDNSCTFAVFLLTRDRHSGAPEGHAQE